MAVLAVVGTLLGALVGALATFGTQLVSLKTAERRDLRARANERRAQVRAGIEAFLESYQEMERIMNSGDLARSDEVSHRMWLRHNKLALIAPEPLVDPLEQLASQLNRAYWDGWPENMHAWDYLHDSLLCFRNAARDLVYERID
ncbi:hypothetical protein ACWDSJ_27835 [Nocardia sp. NPDC003482]